MEVTLDFVPNLDDAVDSLYETRPTTTNEIMYWTEYTWHGVTFGPVVAYGFSTIDGTKIRLPFSQADSVVNGDFVLRLSTNHVPVSQVYLVCEDGSLIYYEGKIHNGSWPQEEVSGWWPQETYQNE